MKLVKNARNAINMPRTRILSQLKGALRCENFFSHPYATIEF